MNHPEPAVADHRGLASTDHRDQASTDHRDQASTRRGQVSTDHRDQASTDHRDQVSTDHRGLASTDHRDQVSTDHRDQASGRRDRFAVRPLDPPTRLLCGPGPTNPDPAVLAAMRRPMLGHLDPDMHDILLEVVELLREVWRASPQDLVLALPATGTSAMEAGIVNLLAPGETLVVAECGFFGRRIAEIARRHGVGVIDVEADWGQAVANERLLAALDEHPEAAMVAVVHAETSTGVEHPLEQLGAALRDRDVLLMADCVTSLGGVELDFQRFRIDYGYACTQKCLGAPPGMAPVALSERAQRRLAERTHPVPFSLDFELLRRYWVQRPAVYHHTAPILHIYALHEALRQVQLEGVESRWRRHAAAGAYLQHGIRALGLELLADPWRQLAPLTAVCVPNGVDRVAVQHTLLREHGIEVGGGLGPDAPSIWRIGLMGPNATQETADAVLDAFESALARSEAAGRKAARLAAG